MAGDPKYFKSFEAPATGLRIITPTDNSGSGADGCRALRVAYGGDVVVTALDGSQVKITNVMPGETLYIFCKNVEFTGTTATGIVGYL